MRAILQEILVQATEADLEPSEVDDTIFFMNNYMTELDANGAKLGYTIVSNVADEITVAAGAINGIIKNVAVMIAPQFDSSVVTNDLIRQARDSLSTLYRLGVSLEPMVFPSTLPIGSGNEHDDFNDQHFYPGPDESTILTEQQNNILIESGTENP